MPAVSRLALALVALSGGSRAFSTPAPGQARQSKASRLLRSAAPRGRDSGRLAALHGGGGGGGGAERPLDVLITGGVGYIGSHTVVELLNAGHNVIVVDNLCNANIECLQRVQRITGKPVPFYECDVRDAAALERVFAAHRIDAVIHFAGLKAVGESVQKPLEYYDCNVRGAVTLLQVMGKAGCKQIVFSSSATVYGDPASVPVDESFPTGATNPYGRTKLMIEEILHDLARSDDEWQISVLRYFNPVGAHRSGIIGEDPKGIPNNLMPFIQQVAVGIRPKLSVFGADYSTHDGTGVRDYIHVVDLAQGHVAALRRMTSARDGFAVYNLGTGQGYSVLDMVAAFSAACGKELPYELAPRRPGDVAVVYAETSKAASELGWRAELGLREMCEDSWRWASNNPNGYGPSPPAAPPADSEQRPASSSAAGAAK